MTAHSAGQKTVLELCITIEPLDYFGTTFGHNARHSPASISIGARRLHTVMPDRTILTVFIARQYQYTRNVPRR